MRKGGGGGREEGREGGMKEEGRKEGGREEGKEGESERLSLLQCAFLQCAHLKSPCTTVVRSLAGACVGSQFISLSIVGMS